MALKVEENGTPVDSIEEHKPDAMINGHAVKSAMKGRKSSRPRKSIASILMRILVWYTIVTALFRCPSTMKQIDDSSPRVCKPYLQIRSHLEPHIKPYYDVYAAPYVEVAQPYAEKFNKHVYTPSSNFAIQNYRVYGAPRVDQARAYGQEQWQKIMLPQLAMVQTKSTEAYSAFVAPYVNQVSAAVLPYYTVARDNSARIYGDQLLPVYVKTKPYLWNAYNAGHHFVVEIGLPYAQQTWSSVLVFVNEAMWPQIRHLYSENVEPQLLKIGDRLTKYREGGNMSVTGESSESVSSVTSSLSSLSSSASAIVSDASQTASSSAKSPPAKKKLSGAEAIAAARDTVTNDLKSWQDKFAKAADKGSDDLDEKAKEVIQTLRTSHLEGDGASHLKDLEKACDEDINELKKVIVTIVESLPEPISLEDEENAESELLAAVRAAGFRIRKYALALREWRNSFDAALTEKLSDAADSTLEILDGIQSLGMQEVGMRWAWMDGITYKDWAKYHALRKTFDEWGSEVQSVALNHPDLAQAKEAADELESNGMALAEKAAKELYRLKDVGKWKIRAKDVTDNFETREVPPSAAKSAKQVAEEIKAATDPVAEKVDDASEGMAESIENAGSRPLGTNQGTVESIVSQTTENAAGAASSLAPNVIGEEPSGADSVVSSISSVASSVSDTGGSEVDVASEKASEILNDGTSIVSETYTLVDRAVEDSETPLGQSVLSDAVEDFEKVTSAASEMADEAETTASSVADHVSSKIWGGAMAQEVKGTMQPILDDVVDESSSFSEKLQSVINDAGDQYAEATRAVSEAMLQATKTQGTVEEVTSVAGDLYSSALAVASSVLYGTSQSTGEVIASVVSSQFDAAVAAASAVIYGTPTPLAQSVTDQASSIYSDAVSRARERYIHAKSIASEHISGTPKPVHEQMLSSIEAAYSGSLDVAKSRLDAAINAGMPTRTQGALESISSIASLRLQEGISTASAQFENARAVVSATPPAAHQAYLNDAKRRYYEAIGLAHERYSDFVTSASSAVYGTPVPAYQQYLSAAQASYDSISSAASSNLASVMAAASSASGMTTESPAQSVLSDASSRYSIAIAQASSSLSAASAAASEAIYGKPTGSFESATSAISKEAGHYASEASAAIMGTDTPLYESIASQASSDWESLIAAASMAVYGAPTPFTDSVISQAGEYTAQATSAAAQQYSAVQALISELVVGQEPPFTSSVMSRFSSVYATGLPEMVSLASSYASEAYASASSVATTVFTPPPTLDAILNSATDQLDAAVSAASVQFYGTTKGTYEQASSAVASSYSYISSQVSDAVYGTPTGYVEAAQSSVQDVLVSAQDAISVAFYGTPTGTVESATSAVASAYSSASSVLAAAVESASARLATFAEEVGEGASEAFEKARESVEDMASSVSSIATEATGKVKDEL